MMHVEALQCLNCIFTRRLRAKCHQLYGLGHAKQEVYATVIITTMKTATTHHVNI